MFQHVQPAPPDAILGITDAFRADARPHKINLAVGVYKDDEGQTPVLRSVKLAEQKLLQQETTKSYLPIEGPAPFGKLARELLLRPQDPRITDGSAVTVASPGGTGALRIAADYLADNHPGVTVWISKPTWPNHPGIFNAAGLPTKTYAWLDDAGFALDLPKLLADLARVQKGDVVVLHGCCHNPTGIDPTPQQWAQIADALAERGALPFIDFAYQGFGKGLDEDLVGVHAVLRTCPQLLVASSFSKNFGLYNERVGALTAFTDSPNAGSAVQSKLKQAIRRNYSNPPSHGLSIVQAILTDPQLKQHWQQELADMRSRIQQMRQQLRQGLDQRGVQLSPTGNAFIETQQGMFTMSGLSGQQVEQLKIKHALYIVADGRINVAGITSSNLSTLRDAIADASSPSGNAELGTRK